MSSRIFLILSLSVCTSLALACDDPDDEGTATAGDGDGDGDETGDGDGDQTGDGDGDVDECEELSGGDALIPGDCRCVEPGAPCSQGCFFPDAVKTCADVCAEVGETCVADGCGDGWTYLEGQPDACPLPSEYGGTASLGCDEPVPILDWPHPDVETIGAACCCTQSS